MTQVKAQLANSYCCRQAKHPGAGAESLNKVVDRVENQPTLFQLAVPSNG
jgi:hypothetical protein